MFNLILITSFINIRLRLALFITSVFICTHNTYGQNCPVNIGFEQGDFQNWECETGNIAVNGDITLEPTEPVPEQHEIITASPQLVTDAYGNFPVNAPNGSGHSVRLGNTFTGQQVDRISYTFTVPQNQTNYSIIYNYAVVFFNPPNNHVDFEQPKFTAKIFDVTANKYTDCGSFDFVSSSSLPGFEQSKMNPEVYFKPWAPITLNLLGYAGKTIRLEFTVNGCTKERGRHFGYAYIDVNENCDSPLEGNTICDPSSITLSAPEGFKEYSWYKASDPTTVLGTGTKLTIAPSPPENTTYAVKIEPYPGYGCPTTLYTTTKTGQALTDFNVTPILQTCYPTPVDLTSAVTGNHPDLKYTYFSDATATTHVRVPTAVVEDGIYYIKATNSTGCFKIKPIQVVLRKVNLQITNPPPSCYPGSIDLTNIAITNGSEAGLTYTFWKDVNATVALTNPEKVELSGTYYIKGTDALGCFTVKPVKAQIADIITTDQFSCNPVDLTVASVTTGSSQGLSFTYWKDELATVSLSDPKSVTVSGTYYIKGTNSGCSKVVPVNVTIYPSPTVSFSNPQPVENPETVDLTLAAPLTAGLNYSYWKDKLATIRLTDPENIQASGTFYIKATNTNGCFTITPINVVIHEPPHPQIITSNTFTPNSDGINDLFSIRMLGAVRINYLKIFNRWGQLIFSTRQLSNFWDGTRAGVNQPIGTYYWTLDGMDEYRNQKVQLSGAITLLR
ncbi:MAG: gliding motility-associated C-terminal domain-containing protein [Sphingobacteriaceae bacterium]